MTTAELNATVVAGYILLPIASQSVGHMNY